MKTIVKLISLLSAAAILFCFFTFSGFAAGEKAYNIYSDPVTTGASGRYYTYSIDFLSDDTADCTYWALANFGLYKSRETLKKYRNISGGGAYAGLQDGAYAKHFDGSYWKNPDGSYYFGKTGILSFWEMTYYDKSTDKNVIMRAKRMYPEGESTFGGEGEGTNCIMPFAWEDSHWYRMILHCWDDAETGTTFVGEWYMDVETGEWTLFSYFDTHLYESLIEGGMGLFMENFSTSTKNEIRTFKTKNIYALDAKDHEWKSFSSCKISYGDGGAADKIGGHEFGATEEYFWGKAGGVVEDQAAYERSAVKSGVYTISQPDQPTFSSPKSAALTASLSKNKTLEVSWTPDKTGAPQQTYTLEVYQNGEKVAEKSQTRPEVNKVDFREITSEDVRCVLTVTDIFGGQAVTEYVAPGYSDRPATLSLDDLPFAPAALIASSMLA